MNNKVKLNNQEYTVSPLKCKHLRKISELVKSGLASTGTFSDLEQFAPFILDSVKVNHPDFTEDLIYESTLQEVLDTWNTIVAISGIEFKPGEKAPTAASIGQPSTVGSVVQ